MTDFSSLEIKIKKEKCKIDILNSKKQKYVQNLIIINNTTKSIMCNYIKIIKL